MKKIFTLSMALSGLAPFMSVHSQVSDRMKERLDTVIATEDRKVQFATISVGHNYALLDGNATGFRTEIEYGQSWSKRWGGTVNLWYTQGVNDLVLIQTNPWTGEIIKKDAFHEAIALDVSIDWALFKTQMHDLTFQPGITLGWARQDAWRTEIDFFQNPFRLYAERFDKPGLFGGPFVKLAYNLRFERFALGLNVVNLNFHEMGGNYYGARLGYVLNKPVFKINRKK